MSRRTEQVGQAIRRHVGELLLYEVRDPRVGFVTITDVDVSPDLEHATLHVSIMGSPEEEEETLRALRKASGFLRTQLARRMRMRHVAELRFVADRSTARAIRISQMLDEVLPDGDEGRAEQER